MSAQFTGQKAQFLNLQSDGLKLRAVKFKDKTKYNRKAKHKLASD